MWAQAADETFTLDASIDATIEWNADRFALLGNWRSRNDELIDWTAGDVEPAPRPPGMSSTESGLGGRVELDRRYDR